MKKYPITIALAATCLLTACSKQSPTDGASSDEVQIPDVFVGAPPEGKPIAIPLAHTQLKPGDDVLLNGLVMGAKSPFVDGRAAFVLGDESVLTPCNARRDDHCPTPWDTCCDAPDVRRKGTATVQVLDKDGKVLSLGLKGVAGLAELSRVTVAGQVAPMSTAEAFIVNATAIHVAKK